MKEIMEATLKDLLHAINILGDDRDVYVDGIDSIAVCSPIKLTDEGKKHFEQALTANVIVKYENGHQATYVCDADEKINDMAWDLLTALAGYCCFGGIDLWFEGPTAEMI